MNIGNKPL